MQKAIVILMGGLGNQMFQYAFYLAMKKRSPNVFLCSYYCQNDKPLQHNGYELERVFGIASDHSSLIILLVRKLFIFSNKKYFKTISRLLLTLIRLLPGLNIIEERGYSQYNSDYLQSSHKGFNLYIGYWQCPSYFDAFRKEVLKAFSFDELRLSAQSQEVLATIRLTESVSVHIRRGDFLSKEVDNCIAETDYYDKAMKFINSKIDNPRFVFFSDEPEWVKAHFLVPNAVYVSWNHGLDDWQDMYLMSQCKHNIIANSTFSWWGAWLNDNVGKRVVCPAVFLKKEETPDIYPKDWIIVS
jgi:hypothetical protein